MEVAELGRASEKFKARAGAAQKDYTEGAAGAAGKWKQSVEASEGTWAEGVAAAAARGAFKKGLAKAPADYYAERVRKLGSQRYTQGVNEGAGNWQEGFAPYAEELRSLTLPPKGIKGSPGNINRVTAVTMALRNRKERG